MQTSHPYSPRSSKQHSPIAFLSFSLVHTLALACLSSLSHRPLEKSRSNCLFNTRLASISDFERPAEGGTVANERSARKHLMITRHCSTAQGGARQSHRSDRILLNLLPPITQQAPSDISDIGECSEVRYHRWHSDRDRDVSCRGTSPFLPRCVLLCVFCVLSFPPLFSSLLCVVISESEQRGECGSSEEPAALSSASHSPEASAHSAHIDQPRPADAQARSGSEAESGSERARGQQTRIQRHARGAQRNNRQ